MKISWVAGAAFAVALLVGLAGASLLHLKGPELAVFMGLLAALGLGAAAAISYFQSKADAKPEAAAAPAAAGGNSELDVLIREANARLAHSNRKDGAGIANLPLIFVIGDRGMAKTSAVVHSGLEPELLAGQVFQDDAIAPTRAANVWFARGHVLVEAGGAVLGDPGNWSRLVKRLQPGKLKSIGKGTQAPRAVLLCFSLESFAQPGGAEAVTAAARYLQARLGDISQLLGISFPVYILFTKTDRVPFFHDFVHTLSNEEANQVFGATVPIRLQATGIYAEEETKRLTHAFNSLFYSLCDKRTVFLPRENDAEMLPGSYEFPREFRKLRTAVVQFMVDVCRPSQLRASPFLRGFYFAGVRPVAVSEAPAMPMLTERGSGSMHPELSGATGMFRVGKQAEKVAQLAVAGPGGGTRKAPQWMFLGHLFNDIILRDSTAMGASGASVKTSTARRVLLACLAGACLLYSVALLVSYSNNRALENTVIAAAGNAAGDPLNSLDTLRKPLVALTQYKNGGGVPLGLRWGLYQGREMYPEVRRIYYARFRQVLWGQTPRDPILADNYGVAYDTLKGYLLIGPQYGLAADRNLANFLADLLFKRWQASPEARIGKDRPDLVKKQFEFYSQDLTNGNPYPYKTEREDPAVDKARSHLSKFSGVDRNYKILRDAAAKQGRSVSFNDWAKGSADTVTSAYPVPWAFTKEGAGFMQAEMKKSVYGGEPWVLGLSAIQTGDKEAMEKGVLARYTHDYIETWRTVLRTSRVKPYADLKDASVKLEQLTGSQAPLLALFWWTTQNTPISLPGVDQAFKAVHKVQPESSVQEYVVDANRAYNTSLIKLQSTVAQAVADPGVTKAIKDDAEAAKQITRQIVLPPDPEANLEVAVKRLLMEPITNLDGLGAPNPTELNKKGAAFCREDFGTLTNRFPFDPKADPYVKLDDLNKVFRPKEGKLWTFYESALKPILHCEADCTEAPNAPFKADPRFLNFFNQAVHISRRLYSDKETGPSFQYALKAQKSDLVKRFEITVNGETSQLAIGDSKTFQWPGGPNPNFKLKLIYDSTPVPAYAFDEPWSVFRFFSKAERRNGDNFVWRATQGGGGESSTYEFSVDAPIFKDLYSGLKCVPTVAH